MSEKKRAKLKLDMIDDPTPLTLVPLEGETTDEVLAKDFAAAKLAEKEAIQAEHDQMREKIEEFRQDAESFVAGGKAEDFIDSLYGCAYTEHPRTELQDEHRRNIERLEDIVMAPHLLGKVGENPAPEQLTGLDLPEKASAEIEQETKEYISTLVHLTRRLRGLVPADVLDANLPQPNQPHSPDTPPRIDGTGLTAHQISALEQFMDVAKRSENGSRRLLAQCCWDVHDALIMHFNFEAKNTATQVRTDESPIKQLISSPDRNLHFHHLLTPLGFHRTRILQQTPPIRKVKRHHLGRHLSRPSPAKRVQVA
jgi:hypothetical protein